MTILRIAGLFPCLCHENVARRAEKRIWREVPASWAAAAI